MNLKFIASEDRLAGRRIMAKFENLLAYLKLPSRRKAASLNRREMWPLFRPK